MDSRVGADSGPETRNPFADASIPEALANKEEPTGPEVVKQFSDRPAAFFFFFFFGGGGCQECFFRPRKKNMARFAGAPIVEAGTCLFFGTTKDSAPNHLHNPPQRWKHPCLAKGVFQRTSFCLDTNGKKEKKKKKKKNACQDEFQEVQIAVLGLKLANQDIDFCLQPCGDPSPVLGPSLRTKTLEQMSGGFSFWLPLLHPQKRGTGSKKRSTPI